MAILCNHQRAVPKGHSWQMEKLEARLLELQAELDTLSADYRAAQRAKNAAKAESCARAPCTACTLSCLCRRCPQLARSAARDERRQGRARACLLERHLSCLIRPALCYDLRVVKSLIATK